MNKGQQEIMDLKKELEISKVLHLMELDATVKKTKRSAVVSVY